MVKEHLLHEMVVLDHLKKVDDIQVSIQLFLTFIELRMLDHARRLTLEGQLTTATGEAFEVVAEGQEHIVSESSLINDQVVDVVELLAFRSMTNKFLSLFFQI